jgi:type IV pilus assembly protein PilB
VVANEPADIEARLQALVTAAQPLAPADPPATARAASSPALTPRPASHPGGSRFSRLGQMMVERGLITEEQLDDALDRQRRSRRRLGETLVEMGAVSSIDLAQALAEHLGVPFVNLDEKPPDLVLAALIPEEVARRYRALPVDCWSNQLVIAMANPNDVFALDDLRVLTGQSIIAALADPQQLSEALERVYHRSGIESSLDDAADDYTSLVDEDPGSDLDAVEDGPVVRLVSALLEQAVAERASDLHIEPASETVRIRLRIDGVLHDTSEASLTVLRPLVSRLKVLAGLDIAQLRVPQDGRFSLNVHQRVVDVRVATIPTAAGEAVVLRLLDPQRGVIDVSSLGLSPEESARLIPAVHASQGAVFITGPTGSGKSSTLYALGSVVNTRDRSIVSVEDPVEYRVDGIKQIQINTRAGMTFPSALRSILRADPDVILIGEVRDAETARIAADASITGHLVLSTLHATRAAAAPIRLVDMGVEPYLVGSALSCVVAQRLVRRLCEHCAEDLREPDIALLRELGADDSVLGDRPSVRVPKGCPACLRTGYRGRMAVFEIMPITEDISRLVVERAASADVERVAVAQGMDTLRIAALRHVVRGELSIEEMLRVVS